MDFLRPAFFDRIASAQTVLLAGAGGGYDIFGGLPLYFGLRTAGKTVHLANLSFSTLSTTSARHIGEALVKVTADTEGSSRYFPEQHLATWFREARQEEVPVYCIDRRGARPVAAAYRSLVKHLGGVDAIILVDGGTDSLMRGDENGLGTPQEDVASINAVDLLADVPTRLLACIGFGVDTFHGVCHAQFLEAVADLARTGDYLGAWSVTAEMPEAAQFRQAVDYVHAKMFNHPSIVSSSIASAIEGRFGNYHAPHRTEGGELFINPLMSLYWTFDLPAVARRCLYLDAIRDTETYTALSAAIELFRYHQSEKPGGVKEWQSLPM